MTTHKDHCHWRELGRDCFGCEAQDAREDRREELKKGICKPFYIVAGYTSRVYGGPEEGGWWVDCDHIEEVRKVYDWRDGLRMARELKKEYQPDPRGLGSVLSGPSGWVSIYRDPSEFPEEPTREDFQYC